MKREEITITELENAINYYRNIEGTDNISISKNARLLADIYGLMIFEKKKFVFKNQLNEPQIAALSNVFKTT